MGHIYVPTRKRRHLKQNCRRKPRKRKYAVKYPHEQVEQGITLLRLWPFRKVIVTFADNAYHDLKMNALFLILKEIIKLFSRN